MTIQEWIAERRRIAEKAGYGTYSTPNDDPELKFYTDALNSAPKLLAALERAVEGLEYYRDTRVLADAPLIRSSFKSECQAAEVLADIQKILEGA